MLKRYSTFCHLKTCFVHLRDHPEHILLLEVMAAESEGYSSSMALNLVTHSRNESSKDSSLEEKPLTDYSSDSSIDAQVSVTFSSSNPHDSDGEHQPVNGSMSALSGFNSYFNNHADGSNSLLVAPEGESSIIDCSNVKQEKMDVFTEDEIKEEPGVTFIKQEEPSSSSLILERERAMLDFFIQKNEKVGSPASSGEDDQAADAKISFPYDSKSDDSFGMNFIKPELPDNINEDYEGEEDQALYEEIDRKHQEILENYTVSGERDNKVYLCTLCDFSTAIICTLKTHIYNAHIEEKLFRCNKCDSSFKRLAQLKKHRVIHSEQKPFLCSFCPKSYADSISLKRHTMGKHTGERPYKCDICDNDYVRKTDLKKHYDNKHSDERPFPCPFCDYRSKDHQTLKMHLSRHSDARPYTCKLCTKSYKRLGDLKVHIQNIHDAKSVYKCEVEGCDYETSKILDYRRHGLVHTGQKLFPCPQCQQNFTSQMLLRQHQRRHSGEKVHNCTLCNYGCLKLFSLKRHVRTHLLENGNQCPICSKGDFLDEAGLIKHVLNHSQRLPYRCNMCPEAFLTPGELYKHKVVHKEERPFLCSMCDWAFKKEQELKRHMLLHTQERPFKCDICGKGFNQQNQLNLHKVVHSDDKPYSCPLCSYTCKRAADLRVHSLRHTEARTISCDLCDYTCKRKRDLNRHMHSHTPDKPYECPVCGLKLRRAYNLRQHMLRHGAQDRGEVSCRICLQSIPNTVGLKAHMAEAHPGVDVGAGLSDGYGDYKTGCGSRLNNWRTRGVERKRKKKKTKKLVSELEGEQCYDKVEMKKVKTGESKDEDSHEENLVKVKFNFNLKKVKKCKLGDEIVAKVDGDKKEHVKVEPQEDSDETEVGDGSDKYYYNSHNEKTVGKANESSKKNCKRKNSRPRKVVQSNGEFSCDIQSDDNTEKL